MKKILAQFAPFIAAGIAIAIGVLFFTIMAYILLFGILVGLILYLIILIKEKFFPDKKFDNLDKFNNKFNNFVNNQKRKRQPRTFDYDDLD